MKSYMTKINKDSYWFKSGLYTFLERGGALIFGFGSFFFLVRVLSREDFGVWALFLTITSVIEAARNGLIQNAQVRFLITAKKKDEKARISTASLILNVILTVLSVLIMLLFARTAGEMWETPVLAPMFHIYALTTVLLIPFSQFNFIQQANLNFKGIFYSNFIRQSFLFIYIFTAFWFEYKISLILLSWVLAIAAAFAAFISFLFAREHMVFAKKPDWMYVKKLFHFGKYVFGTNVSSIFYKSIDQMMLGSFISTGSVAIYNTAVRISNLVEVPTTSVASIVFPQSARKMKSEGKEAVKDLYEKSVAVILALIIPAMAFILIFPEFVILIVAGDKYLDTADILRVTILFSLFIPFQRQFGTVMDSSGKPKWNFFFMLSGAVLNVVFNYFFIMNMGIIGAAYGSLSSYILIFIVNQIILYKYLKVRTFNIIRYCWKFYKEAWSFGIFKFRQVIFKSSA